MAYLRRLQLDSDHSDDDSDIENVLEHEGVALWNEGSNDYADLSKDNLSTCLEKRRRDLVLALVNLK